MTQTNSASALNVSRVLLLVCGLSIFVLAARPTAAQSLAHETNFTSGDLSVFGISTSTIISIVSVDKHTGGISITPAAIMMAVHVSLPDTSAAPGDTILIPIEVTETTGLGILATEITITYDTSLVTVIGADLSGSLLEAADWLMEFNVGVGSIAVAMGGDEALSGSGTFITLAFAVNDRAQGGSEAILAFADILFNEGDPPASTQDGSISVIAPVIETSVGIIFFGEIERDSTKSEDFFIFNTSQADLVITDMNVEEPAFAVDDTTGLVPSGDTLIVTVRFTPTELTFYVDTLRIVSNAGTAKVVLVGNGIIAVAPEDPGLPSSYALEQNYPNPFNPVTTISYALPKTTSYSLIVYDLMGREVMRWSESDASPGFYNKLWNGANSSGIPVSTGLYIYRLVAGDFVSTRKMILLK